MEVRLMNLLMVTVLSALVGAIVGIVFEGLLDKELLIGEALIK
jgi:predicted lysophospholipase L1 biosynthesis ABC-type transport system permease subunit